MSFMQRFDFKALADLRRQWQASRLLRVGVLATLALLASEGLFRTAEIGRGWQAQAELLSQRNATLKADLRQQEWSQRRDDARQQLLALRNMLWNEGDPALAQARVQDWLRAMAAKTQLPLRDLSVARQASDEASAGAAGAASAPMPLAGEDVQVLRAHLAADFKRLALLMFLAELAASEDVVVVERINIRTAQKPGTVTLDLRFLSGPLEARR